MEREKAEKIVDEIIEDISGRSGIGDEWDMIDSDIKEEIKSDMVAIIIKFNPTT